MVAGGSGGAGVRTAMAWGGWGVGGRGGGEVMWSRARGDEWGRETGCVGVMGPHGSCAVRGETGCQVRETMTRHTDQVTSVAMSGEGSRI